MLVAMPGTESLEIDIDLNTNYGGGRALVLEEIKCAMHQLLDAADKLVREADDKHIHARAKGCWIAHIRTALDHEHSYIGKSMVTMQDTVDELAAEGEEEDDEADVVRC